MVQFNAYGFNHDIYSALLYFIQPLVNAMHYPRRKTHILCHDGIIAIIIIYASLQSACLKFILGDKCNVLIIQMHFAHSHYAKVGKAQVNNSNDKLSNNVKIRLTMIRLKVIKTFHQYNKHCYKLIAISL